MIITNRLTQLLVSVNVVVKTEFDTSRCPQMFDRFSFAQLVGLLKQSECALLDKAVGQTLQGSRPDLTRQQARPYKAVGQNLQGSRSELTRE